MASSFFVMVSISVLLIIFGAIHGYQHYQLKNSGKTLIGRVLWKSDHHTVFYQFKDPNGHKIRWFAQLNDKAYKQAKEGETILISYLPSNPTISEVTHGGAYTWVSQIIVGLISFSCCSFICQLIIRKVLKRQRLMSSGRMVPAQIIGVESGKPRLVYQFTDERGFLVSGKQIIPRDSDVPFWERNLNRHVAAYYDPSNPKDNLVAVEGVWENPQLMKRTEAVTGTGRWVPLYLCFVLVLWNGFVLWECHLFLFVYSGSIFPNDLVYFAFPFILIPVVGVAGLGIDSILGLAQRAKLLTGLPTTSQSIYVDLNPMPPYKNVGPPHQLSYQYTDQNGVIYDGWVGLSKRKAKAWNNRLKTPPINLEVYYDPAKPTIHTLIES